MSNDIAFKKALIAELRKLNAKLDKLIEVLDKIEVNSHD